jgi:Glycosyl transferase family 2
VATVSACVIAFEEEERLPACLAGLSFCDEVIVVDSGSRDRTREIARAAGAVVIENPWPGFAAQRNVALDAASGDWVLEVDADERVSPELGTEIRALVERAGSEVRMAAIPLRQFFLGKALGPSGRYPGYRHRLFRRGAYRHDEGRTVHEGLWPDGPTPPLEHDLRHVLAASWGEALRDAVAYARLEATQRRRPGAKALLIGTLVRPAAKFGYRCLIYGGWRDGALGVARIGLECGADGMATVLGLGLGAPAGSPGFGQEAPRRGPVRIVGVCLRRRGVRPMSAWLAAAAAAGVDVALVAPGAADEDPVPRRRLHGAGPGELARALDAEDQARPIDALLLHGPLERALVRFAPRAIRGFAPPLDPSTPVAEGVARVQEGSRAAP